MKVLMITPRVDMEHDIFGFIHGWVDELSKRVDSLEVVTFGVGKTKLGDNVNLYSAYSKYQPVKFLKLNKFLLSLTPRVDVVFTHMYPWLPIAAAPYAKVFGKPLVMWNTHGYVDFKKKIAVKLVDKVVTASDRSFNIKTDKKIILGHGVDTNKFKPASWRKRNGKFKTVSVGRVEKIKGYDMVIEALNVIDSNLRNKLYLTIVGPVYDRDYYYSLKMKIEKYRLNDRIKFLNSVPFGKINEIYRKADLYISASTTDSLDKTTLEAMACSLPVIVCNEAFLDIFDKEMKEKCYFEKGNYRELAEKIEYFMKNEENELRRKLRKIVVKGHSIENLSKRLVDVFESVIE